MHISVRIWVILSVMSIEFVNLQPETYPSCPACHENAAVIPIFYGLRSPYAINLSAKGSAELGGYFQKPDAPVWRCKACGLPFIARV